MKLVEEFVIKGSGLEGQEITFHIALKKARKYYMLWWAEDTDSSIQTQLAYEYIASQIFRQRIKKTDYMEEISKVFNSFAQNKQLNLKRAYLFAGGPNGYTSGVPLECALAIKDCIVKHFTPALQNLPTRP